jgi:predicted ribosomally synthesized peptide with SipW-like signal peptide
VGRRGAGGRTRLSRGCGWLSRRQNGVIALVAVGISAALVLTATNAAFTATTTNPGNTFAAGSVALSDDDNGSAMFSTGNLKPGDSETHCILVSYSGTLGAQVRLYGTTTGTGLGTYLHLR